MTPTPAFRGVHVPLVTPFDADGRVAFDALSALADEVLLAGAAGLVALGTTAETTALDAAEKAGVVRTCAGICARHGARLVVGAGTADTTGSIAALAALAADAAQPPGPRIDAALVPVPYYVRPSARGVLAHFTALAATSPVPVIVYHVPYRTGQPLDAAALRGLAAIPGVVGVKYATGALDDDAVDLLVDHPAGFAVLAGDDVLFSPMLALGADGGILASAQLATTAFVDLATAWRDGDLDRVGRLGPALARLSSAAFAEPNPTVIKAVLHAQGRIPTPDVRLPLLPPAPAAIEAAVSGLAESIRPGVGPLAG